MNGLMTEREWRKQHSKKAKRPEWWGAQCVINHRRGHPLQRDRAFHLFLLFLSVVVSALLPCFVSRHQNITVVSEAVFENGFILQPRRVSAIHYEPYPAETLQSPICTISELAGGKMLFLDERHPFPDHLPPPNTFSIASYGRGMVPVSKLQIQSGKETIDALQKLFHSLREKGVHNLQVCAGTISKAQQREQMILALRTQMKTAVVSKALADILSRMDWPGTGEMLGEYSIELCFHPQAYEADEGVADAAAEQILFQTAWRCGFVCTKQSDRNERVYRFRYVGIAHATAMTFLDLDLEDYLHFLHQKGSLTIWEHEKPKYLIVCRPVNGTRVQFDLPVGAQWEASLDNLGYAVAACVL